MAKRDVRQQNRNSQNEPGMSFVINETEKRVWKEAAEPAFTSSPQGVKPFTANSLPCDRPASPRSDCWYHIEGIRLMPQISGIRGKFSGVKAPRDVGLSVIAGASRRVSGVRNSMRLPGHDVIRSIPNAIVVAGSRQLHSRGLGMAKRDVRQLKSKFAKRTWNVLCNQRNRKMGWGRRRLNPHSLRPREELSHSLPTCYVRTAGFTEVGVLVSYCSSYTWLHNFARIRGKFSGETKPSFQGPVSQRTN